jgi:hypothetical protein
MILSPPSDRIFLTVRDSTTSILSNHEVLRLGGWVNFDNERNKKMPAQKAGGRYKGTNRNGDMVL